jgi:hypothetical protein
MRMIYVDDSGDETRSLLSALVIPDRLWASYLKSWLTFRRQLFRDHAVPATYELHAQDWLSKSPEPLLLPDGSTSTPDILRHARDARRERALRYEKALKVISTFAEARLITVYRDGTDKFGLYAELLGWVDDYLRIEGEYGMVVLDGLDQGLHYRAKHRELQIGTRRIIEDPMECPSHGSQLIQMVDLCVHAAFRHVRDSPSDTPQMRSLYPRILGKLAEPVGGSGIAHIKNWP